MSNDDGGSAPRFAWLVAEVRFAMRGDMVVTPKSSPRVKAKAKAMMLSASRASSDGRIYPRTNFFEGSSASAVIEDTPARTAQVQFERSRGEPSGAAASSMPGDVTTRSSGASAANISNASTAASDYRSPHSTQAVAASNLASASAVNVSGHHRQADPDDGFEVLTPPSGAENLANEAQEMPDFASAATGDASAAAATSTEPQRCQSLKRQRLSEE